MGYYEVQCNNPSHKRTPIMHGGALMWWLKRHRDCGGTFAWGTGVTRFHDEAEVVDHWTEQAKVWGPVIGSD